MNLPPNADPAPEGDEANADVDGRQGRDGWVAMLAMVACCLPLVVLVLWLVLR